MGKSGDRLAPAFPHARDRIEVELRLSDLGRIWGVYWLSHIPVNGAAVPPLRSQVNLYKSAVPSTVVGTPGITGGRQVTGARS